MIEAIIYALITICLLALVIYLVIWVLTTVIGVPIPAKVIQILWVIFALVCILILVRLLLPYGGKILGAMLPLLV
jgi:hypothetical protein